MKIISLVMFVLIFTTLCFAQQNVAQTPKPLKLVFLNTSAFYDEKTGITKLMEARKKFQQEMNLQAKNLSLMSQEIDKLRQEIINLSAECTSNCEKSIKAKITEHQILVDKYSNKEKLFVQSINNSESEIVSLVRKQIGEVMKMFMKEKSIDLLLDPERDGDFIDGSIIAPDITKEFIDFCNKFFNGEKA